MIAFTSGLASLLVITATGAAGLPFGVPPAPDDPAVARALPEGCLDFASVGRAPLRRTPIAATRPSSCWPSPRFRISWPRSALPFAAA